MKEILEILKEIIVEQATREVSGTDWAKEMLEKVTKLENDLNNE